ncbi:MAG: peptidylprolyl isomerase [Clostridia bacterium]|nr:peptidylprolyl isomerase [Clostridia bacterium]
MKKILSVIIIITILTGMLFVLSGCESSNSSDSTTNTTTTNAINKTSNENTVETTNTNSIEKEESGGLNVDYKANAEKQMAMPQKGEQVAIMHVKDFGDIKFKFFPEVAPKAVENFLTHAKEGYYNGVIFHRVMNEFMIQGGDPEGTGFGGESIWGKGFELEVDYSVLPYRGSLCMARSTDPNSNGSQFFITQANYNASVAKQLSKYPSIVEQYEKYGGYMGLWMNYTVFGQVYEGMDVVDSIAKTEVRMSDSGEKSVPVKDVVIDSIDVMTY